MMQMKLEETKVSDLTPYNRQVIAGNIDRIAAMIHQNAVVHEFHDFSEPDSSFMNRELMNLIGEAAELRDAERDGMLHELCDKAQKMESLGVEPTTCLEEEYADIIIRAMDQLVRLTRNRNRFRSVGDIIIAKMRLNESRPIKHGRTTA